MDSLEELVEQSDRLLMEIQGDTDLPLITRSLDQMGALSEKLCSSRGVRSDVKAARLLGSTIDYDLPNTLAAKLESLSQVNEFEFSKPMVNVDIHTFLRHERENILFTASEQTKRMVNEEVDSLCHRSTSAWWDRQAAAILTALASSSGPIDTAIIQAVCSTANTDTSFSREFLSRSSFAHTADSQINVAKEELYYADQVDKHLRDRLSPTQTVYLRQVSTGAGSLEKTSLFDSLYFSSNSQSVFFDETKQDDFRETFRLIKRMFSRSAMYVEDSGNSETHVQDLTLPSTHDRALTERSGIPLQSAFLSRAIVHLEAEFGAYMETIVASNPHLAKLGGRPGVRDLVRAFLNVKFPSFHQAGDDSYDNSLGDSEDGVVDGKPVWPMIYYCLRSGALSDAVSVASDASNNLGDFVQILSTYVEEGRSLPAKLVTSVRKTYLRVVKSSRDPYKRLVYCLMGRCDLSDAHSMVCRSVDDFLWLRLSQVTLAEVSTDSVEDGEALTLGQFKNLIYETYGETYFDAWNQPLLYFKILCLSQQFEGAIGFLSRIESLRCHAVHLALALRDMKILILPKSKQAPLVSRVDSDPIGFRRLNFIRLLLLYTRKFESGNPVLCVNYYYFLHDLPAFEASASTATTTTFGRSATSLFTQCVAELAIQSGQFEALLGKPVCSQDGPQRIEGAIDRFSSVVPPATLIGAVAEALKTRGQLRDAVRVYLLAAAEPSSLLAAVRLSNLLLVGVVALDENSSSDTSFIADRQIVMKLATEVGYRVRRFDPITTSTGGAGRGPASPDPGSGSAGGGTDSASSLQSAARSLYYLLDLATFFDLGYGSGGGGQWQAALDHMDRLGLFPSGGGAEEVEAKVTAFAALPDLVRRPLPAALLLVMRCLTAKANSALTAKLNNNRSLPMGHVTFGIGGSGIGGGSGPSVLLSEVRARIRALVTFIGRIPFRMPSDVYIRLSQLEMQLASVNLSSV